MPSREAAGAAELGQADSAGWVVGLDFAGCFGTLGSHEHQTFGDFAFVQTAVLAPEPPTRDREADCQSEALKFPSHATVAEETATLLQTGQEGQRLVCPTEVGARVYHR